MSWDLGFLDVHVVLVAPGISKDARHVIDPLGDPSMT
jgi:hypothetical protein